MRLFLGMALSLILAGCASAPSVYRDIAEGNWHARALIRDIELSRTYIVNLDINLVRNQRARMDVTTAVGTGVASLTVDSKEVRYILVDSKRFYYGSPQPGVMRPILSIPFDPRWLQNVLLDEPITDKGWSCSAGDPVTECRDVNSQVKVTWSDRHGEKKTVLIEHPKASVQIKVQSFKPKVEGRPNLFNLEPPNGYQKIRVR